MGVLELILIFFEEIFLFVLKIKNTVIRNIIVALLVILISIFIIYLLYITIIISLSSAPWYIKLLLIGICIPCIYIVFLILSNGYKELKDSKIN